MTIIFLMGEEVITDTFSMSYLNAFVPTSSIYLLSLLYLPFVILSFIYTIWNIFLVLL